MIRFAGFAFLLVIKGEVEFFFEEFESGLGIVGVANERLAVFDHLAG